jgi:hypothetical protein
LGIVMTLAIRGYQFGGSNHNIYLPAALRVNDPTLLENDWWTTETLQYHGLFTHLSAALMRWQIIEPAFLGGYLALAILLHVAWLRLTLAVGGGTSAYLLSVILYYLSGGGVGLGMYAFLQDGAFLPSNIANVAMLWGIYFWITGRCALGGVALGVAAMFHLNHAIVAGMLWFGLTIWSAMREGAPRRTPWLFGSATLALLSLFSLVSAVRVVLSRTGQMPLSEFVNLYVRLRHPHHYDPLSWHWSFWLAFLWPLPLVWLFAGKSDAPSHVRFRRVFVIFSVLLIVAFLGAGVFFVTETLIHMSLYRFSIYVKLMGCIAAASLLWHRRLVPHPALTLLIAGIAILLAIALYLIPKGASSGPLLFLIVNRSPLMLFLAAACAGLISRYSVRAVSAVVLAGALMVTLTLRGGDGVIIPSVPKDDDDYLALCDWVADNTDRSSLFLVPPNEQSFRLRARRAIVVNFKGVPQLSGELKEWRQRLVSVLAVENLMDLPHRRFDRTSAAMARRYDELNERHLLNVARYYGATHIVSARPLDFFVQLHRRGRYYVYAVPARPS